LVNFQKLEKNPNTCAYKTNNCLILKLFVEHIKTDSSRLKVSWSLWVLTYVWKWFRHVKIIQIIFGSYRVTLIVNGTLYEITSSCLGNWWKVGDWVKPCTIMWFSHLLLIKYGIIWIKLLKKIILWCLWLCDFESKDWHVV
jgi:hypothetical protein